MQYLVKYLAEIGYQNVNLQQAHKSKCHISYVLLFIVDNRDS